VGRIFIAAVLRMGYNRFSAVTVDRDGGFAAIIPFKSLMPWLTIEPHCFSMVRAPPNGTIIVRNGDT